MSTRLAFAIIILGASALSAQEEDRPLLDGAGRKLPWIEQFDGKALQGWKVDGENAIEGGLLRVGGKAEAKLQLTTPLGEQFRVLLEYKYTGPPPLYVYYQAAGPFQKMELSWEADDWTEYKFKRTRGNLGFGTLFNFNQQSKAGAGGGGLSYGDGEFREFSLIVAPGRTLTIRRLALVTTPPAPPAGFPWTPLAVVGLVLLGVMALGWYVNRRKSPRAATPSTP